MTIRAYSQFVKCADCGRKIPICNAYYLNGKTYGYSCYKKQLALIYKKWKDEKNAEYSAKCFAAMQIFQNKKSNSFHDSICKQWNDCKKLTAKQLECIIKGFTDQENIKFWIIWQQFSSDDFLKSSIASWMEGKIRKTHSFEKYLDNESVLNCIACSVNYKHGFHLYKEIDDPFIYIESNGRNNERLDRNKACEYLEILKIIER